MKNILFILSICLMGISAQANERQIAWKLHNRIAGVPPSNAVLNEMASLITQGDVENAAFVAMKNPHFYNVTLKNWIKPWSNRDQNPRVAFNDYVATIIGVIKEDLPFDKILYDDILFTINNVTPPYSNKDNQHYANAENQFVDIMNNLVMRRQSEVTGLNPEAVAGVTTTRNSAENYFQAGTNRRVNRFIFMNYLCKDYEDLHDLTVPDFRVARDVERNPGGDSRTYKNRCVGCHAGQDGLRGAYAYYTFGDGQLQYTPGQVQGKMNQNNYFSQGFVTTNDQWINLWATGQNAVLGWRGNTSGNGAQSLGKMFAGSKAFSSCMAHKVFKLVCMKKAKSAEDIEKVSALATNFESDYNMKRLIAQTSAGCVVHED